MTRLSNADLEAVLSFLEEAQTVEGPVPFTRQVLDVVGCSYATFTETDQSAITGLSTSYTSASIPPDGGSPRSTSPTSTISDPGGNG